MRNVPASLALAVLAGACARPYPPPGGEQDTTAPRLQSVTPEALAVLPNHNGPVVFRFDERLSERGWSESLVVVSPLDGAQRVHRSRREVSVAIDGGWRPNRIYRVIIEPGLRDMFGNTRDEPIELVFSTGPPVPSTAIAGIVEDRVSGRGDATGVVTAVRRADTVAYMALADSSGFFALRYVPLGVYDMRAFSDQNRNRRHDPTEPADSGRSVSLGSAADTITAVFSLIPPDTSPPRVTSAEAVDSLHVRVTFDDHLEPVDSVMPVRGQVLALPDSTPYATAAAAFHPTIWERQRPVPADTTAADTLRPRAPPRRQEDTRLLPSRDVVLRLQRPLPPARYVINVAGAVNLNRLSGGGAVEFEVRAAPARAPRPDTTRASTRSPFF
jgi:hypothetical protein